MRILINTTLAAAVRYNMPIWATWDHRRAPCYGSRSAPPDLTLDCMPTICINWIVRTYGLILSESRSVTYLFHKGPPRNKAFSTPYSAGISAKESTLMLTLPASIRMVFTSIRRYGAVSCRAPFGSNTPMGAIRVF